MYLTGATSPPQPLANQYNFLAATHVFDDRDDVAQALGIRGERAESFFERKVRGVGTFQIQLPMLSGNAPVVVEGATCKSLALASEVFAAGNSAYGGIPASRPLGRFRV